MLLATGAYLTRYTNGGTTSLRVSLLLLPLLVLFTLAANIAEDGLAGEGSGVK